MSILTPTVIAEPLFLLDDVDGLIVRIGLVLAFLGMVHAGISIDRSEVNGLRTIVIPVRTATILTVAAGLIAFGLTLE